jgi:sterol desaturase/sphingolipid hydroxylase (fatty acid hydroxylase superfamily)
MPLEEIIQASRDSLELPFSYLINPDKRIHYLYLISALGLALFVLIKAKGKENFLHYIFNKKVWLSQSALVDYQTIFFNGFVKLFLIAPFLVLAHGFSMYIEEVLIHYRGYSMMRLSQTETIIYYTIALTLFSDLLSYTTHFLFHKIPILWEFHKIHHSATVLNPITQYRLHPVELIFNNLKFVFVYGLLTGVFEYLSVGIVSKYLFMGVNVLGFVFLLWGSNLRHSHVKLTYFNFLEYIFISPFQHQIHHSDKPDHYDKNFGSKLALWDWLFGTLLRSKKVNKITFGLGVEENKRYHSFLDNMLQPFRNIMKKKRL